ncbi:MAG TPA: LiaF domain-containing protein [Lachnospiraceae bacterium]|nr:LiaF domain-containing protein [Lachnospiraceae bacterium]
MKAERIFWGIFLILGAIFIIVAKLGFMQGISIWRLIWTVFFAAVLVKSLIKLNHMGIFLSLALLAIVYTEQLQIQAITPWPVLGAAVLLGIGCSMIFPKKHWKRFGHCGNMSFTGSEQVINESDGSNCQCTVSFGSSVKYINTDAFESGSFDASFGSMKVFFDNAIMKGTEAHIHVNNSFGGIELYIPKTWKVINHVDSCFGGVDEKGHCEWDGVHSLYVEGDNSFGGITILYV